VETREEVLSWLADRRLFHLATVEGDQPRVRVFGSALVIDDRVHFFMGKFKDVYRQVTVNPKVEMCFYDPEEGRQVRVSGVASQVADECVWSVVFEMMPFARSLAERRGLDNMALFRVDEGSAVVWTRATSTAPKQPIDL
jgi:uncharacterized pyridoxamine 5'-phosphate oxidase family protein